MLRRLFSQNAVLLLLDSCRKFVQLVD
jgi:hypothetical protein